MTTVVALKPVLSTMLAFLPILLCALTARATAISKRDFIGFMPGNVGPYQINIAIVNQAGVNFGATLAGVANFQPSLIKERFIKSNDSASAVVNVYDSWNGSPKEVTVNYNQVPALYSTWWSWPSVIAKAYIQAGYKEDFPGILAPFDISQILGAFSGKEVTTTYKASSDEANTDVRAFYKDKFDSLDVAIVQTKTQTTKLKPNYAYMVQSRTNTQNYDQMMIDLFDPSVDFTHDDWTVEQIKADTDYIIGTKKDA